MATESLEETVGDGRLREKWCYWVTGHGEGHGVRQQSKIELQLIAFAALSENLGLGPQHPSGGSQCSATPVPEDLMASSDLGYQIHVWYIDIHASQHSCT